MGKVERILGQIYAEYTELLGMNDEMREMIRKAQEEGVNLEQHIQHQNRCLQEAEWRLEQHVNILEFGGVPRNAETHTLDQKGPCMELWFSIFKSDQWLRKMVEEQSTKPVLVVSHFRRLPGKSRVILYVCNKGRQFSPSLRLFRQSLQDHTVTVDAEIHLKSGVTLNVQDLFDRSSVPTVRPSNPTDVLELREKHPVI